METLKDNIIISSFNCNGLRDNKKRKSVFNWLKAKHSGIILLQETHSQDEDEQKWELEWGGKIIFSHGTSQSRGVAVLLPQGLVEKCKIKNTEIDENGRIILIDYDIESNNFTLINIYAPTKDQYREQMQFSEYLRNFLQEKQGNNLILGGDFNTYLNHTLDKKGGSNEPESKYAKQLISICEEFDLIDIWRLHNPKTQKFTWRDNTRVGLVQSRLDYFLVSRHLNNQISKTCFKPGFKSDHSLINIEVDLLHTQKRGKGYWKFNNSLLHDKTYVSLIKEELKGLASNNEIQDKSCFWDFVKCQIRTITISYCKTLAKQKKDKENTLIRKIEELENDIESDQQEYHKLKYEWEKLQDLKTQGAIVRSKVEWTEHGEKNSKFFLNMAKRNYNLKYIKKLIINNSEELTKPDHILKEEKQFYKNLYTAYLLLNFMRRCRSGQTGQTQGN